MFSTRLSWASMLGAYCMLGAIASCTPTGRPGPSEFQKDIERICNVEELSGASQVAPGDRSLHTGIWLSDNIGSKQGRALSAELVSLEPEKRKARMRKLLIDNAPQKGKPADCPILKAW